MSLLACATLIAVAIIPQTASAQQSICNSHDTLLGAFAKRYGEAPTGRGLVGLGESKLMVELWTSPEGSWTMVVVTPTGMTCVKASGEGWIEIPYEPFIPSSLPISHDPDAQFHRLRTNHLCKGTAHRHLLELVKVPSPETGPLVKATHDEFIASGDCVRLPGYMFFDIIEDEGPYWQDPRTGLWTHGIRVHFRGEDWWGLGVRPR